MQRWREQYLGLAEFLPAMALAEVDQFFTLTRQELNAAEVRRGPLNRLSVALQIGFLRMTGRMLNSCQIVPTAVLEHLGRQLDLVPPQLASIRGLYRRKRTLFDHQHVAMAALGFRYLTEHAERGLTTHLRRSAETTFSVDALVRTARVWLYEHGYVLPGDKRITLLARRAQRHVEAALSRRIAGQFSTETVAKWVATLTAPREGGAATVLEWLRDAPHRAGRHDIGECVQRAQLLRDLGAGDGDWTDIAQARLYHYAKPMLRRKPSAVSGLREPRRTVETACFLRWQLSQVTDTVLDLADHRTTDLWRAARERVEDAMALQLGSYQRVIATVIALADDASVSDQAFRERVRAATAPFAAAPGSNRAAAIRTELSGRSATVRPLLKQLTEVPLDFPAGHPLATALPLLRSIYAEGGNMLPAGTSNPFPTVWAPLIEGAVSPQAALGAYEAATLMTLKRSLRNGSASTRQSWSHRAPEHVLVPAALWQREGARLVHEMGLPGSREAFVTNLLPALEQSLASLEQAVADETLFVENGRLRIPRLPADPETAEVEQLRAAMFAANRPGAAAGSADPAGQ